VSSGAAREGRLKVEADIKRVDAKLANADFWRAPQEVVEADREKRGSAGAPRQDPGSAGAPQDAT
jgi:hypothetical protein